VVCYQVKVTIAFFDFSPTNVFRRAGRVVGLELLSPAGDSLLATDYTDSIGKRVFALARADA